MRALFLIVFLAACVAPPTDGKSPNERPLAGTRWVMVTDARAVPTLEFREAGRASGFSGCNQWFAQVDRTDGALRFAAIGMTRRACDSAAMDVERAFGDALESTHAAQVEADTLTLIGENGEAVARCERAR